MTHIIAGGDDTCPSGGVGDVSTSQRVKMSDKAPDDGVNI